MQLQFFKQNIYSMQNININININLEKSCCPVGCAVDDDFVISGRDRLHNLAGEFSIVRCRTCGLMRTNPRPDPKTIGFYYPDDYGPYLGTQFDRIKKNRSRFATLRTFAKRIFVLNTNCLPDVAIGRMLEIGCASGGFMHEMATLGWEVAGIEFSPKAAETARALGYSVHTGDMESAPAPNKLYDLIVGWMVLEHLHEPVLSLTKLHAWSSPGAMLAVSVPNAGAWQFRLFGAKWFPLQLPTHLFHFTPETVRMVLAKGGWEVTHVHYQRVLTDPIASIGYILQDKGFRNLGKTLVNFTTSHVIWTAILYPLSWIASFMGQTGRMTIWARRVD